MGNYPLIEKTRQNVNGVNLHEVVDRAGVRHNEDHFAGRLARVRLSSSKSSTL